MERLSRTGYFIELTRLIARRSPCLSRQVGAIIVENNRVVSSGYNGLPAGYKHCIECKRKESGTNLDNCKAIHAEANAILEAVKSSRKGDTIYCTTQPCFNCLKLIIAFGIKNIIYINKYPGSDVRQEMIVEGNINEKQYIPIS